MNRLLRPAPTAVSSTANALSRAFDVAATTVVFGLLGWLLDRWLGTSPVFLVIVSLLAAIGQFVRLAYSYTAEMRVQEKALRGGGASASPVEAASPPADRAAP